MGFLFVIKIRRGAVIVDKFPRTVEDAATETKAKAKPGQRRPAASEVGCAA
ncbi:MAG: hypothetical protein IDH49_02945 [Gammaproteobacteria bacterium]|nr:hypothetical protein [Gammaproteobacteria bacterium]